MKSLVANWKTTVAGLAWIALFGLQSVGVMIPGVHVDPSGLPLALALLFAKDGNVTGGNVKQVLPPA